MTLDRETGKLTIDMTTLDADLRAKVGALMHELYEAEERVRRERMAEELRRRIEAKAEERKQQRSFHRITLIHVLPTQTRKTLAEAYYYGTIDEARELGKGLPEWDTFVEIKLDWANEVQVIAARNKLLHAAEKLTRELEKVAPAPVMGNWGAIIST